MSKDVERAKELGAKFRRDALDTFTVMYPKLANSINVQEVTAGLCIAAGELLRQHCPEELRPEAVRILIHWLYSAAQPYVEAANEPETAPDQAQGDKKPEQPEIATPGD